MLSEVRVLDLGPRLCGEMGSHTPVKGKSGDRNPVEPPNTCPGAGHRKSLQDIPAEFESQTDNHAGVAKSGRRAGFRIRCLMTWGFEALRPHHFGGCSRVSWFPLQGDCMRGALPRSSTTQQNTKRSSSTVFTRGLAGSSPVCCTKLLSSSWTRTPSSQGGDRGS